MESAVLIPVLLAVMLLLIQPGIVLYDRIVMRDAAAEACRVLMTLPGGDDGTLESFVRRRLGSVPQTDAFHVHGTSGCSWRIACVGGASSDKVSVTVGNEIRPLPLIGFGAGLLGAVNEAGNLEFEVRVEMPVRDGWLAGVSAGASPAGWVGAWLDA
ncbi:MAG: pilus assembly protein [Eggerthellaceae bacterium]|nr:pilus assembly protein [Eggerthellaceae bacterium]